MVFRFQGDTELSENKEQQDDLQADDTSTVSEETAPVTESAPEAPLSGDDLFSFDDLDDDASEEEAVTQDVVPDEAPAELDPVEEEKRRKGMRWFVIHANTGHENKVKRNIEMAIKANEFEDVFGEILVATQDVTEMKNGRRVTSKRKFFPSYVLVEMVMSKATQHFINSIPGVTRFIGGTQQRPQPISRAEVDRILGRMTKTEEKGGLLEIPYQVGDSVQVIDGPFSDWVGVINEINHEKGKLKVMISIFGSETPVELDFLQVKEV